MLLGPDNSEPGQRYPVGILVCETLYNSLKPLFSGGKLPECPVEVYPRDCTGGCCESSGFREAASGLASRCSEICLLTCSNPENRYPPAAFPGKLIPARQGADLLYTPDVISGRLSSGEYFVLPPEPGDYRDYISFLKSSLSPGETPAGIIVPDTGTGAVPDGFLRDLEEAFGVPAVSEEVSLESAVDHIGRLLSESFYRNLAENFEESESVRKELKRELSDSMTALDMLGLLVGLKDEENVIETTIELFSMLCSPAQITYTGITDGIVASVTKLKPNAETRSVIDLPIGTEMPAVATGSTGSGFILPVSVWGEIVGLLSIEGIGPDVRTGGHERIAALFLPLCGLVVKNARNYDALEAAIKGRDEEINLRIEAEQGLSAAIRKLNLLSGVTRHDILNQLVVANYYLETTMEDTPEIGTMLKPVKKSVDEIHRQIEFTKNYQDLGVLPPSWHNLVKMIRGCLGERDYPPEVGVEIDLPDIGIFGDAMLGKAFCNVISNAFNHAGGMKNLRISGRAAESGSFIVVVSDDGEGVPEENKELIFKRGHGKNHGYGLFLVREILGLTDIKIRETGVYGEGAVFEIEIPPGSWLYREENSAEE